MRFLQDVIAASRPIMWAYTGFLYLFGVLAAYKTAGILPGGAVWGYGAWVAAGSNLFGLPINDYFDRHIDARNPRKRHPAPTPAVLAAALAASLGSLALLELVAPDWRLGLLMGVAIIANLLYSMPPLRLKRVPLVDILVGPASFATVTLAGYVAVAHAWPAAATMVAAVLLFCSLELIHKTLDLEADAAAGVRGSAVVLGRQPALLAAGLGLILAGVCAALRSPLWPWGALPYLGIVAIMLRHQGAREQVALDRRLPYWYLAAGFAVTCGMLLLS